MFANVEYWKRIGEEYQQPLIVTGTVMFAPQARSGIVQRDQEVYDSFGRRRVVPVRTYMERKGFVLKPKFIFIDGRTGTVLHSENYREEILYNANQNISGAVLVLRIDGPTDSELPQHAQQPDASRAHASFFSSRWTFGSTSAKLSLLCGPICGPLEVQASPGGSVRRPTLQLSIEERPCTRSFRPAVIRSESHPAPSSRSTVGPANADQK